MEVTEWVPDSLRFAAASGMTQSPRVAKQGDHHVASSRSRKRWILPVCVFGKASVNFSERGYL